MTNEQIEKFVSHKYIDVKPVQINFKTRPSITGIFIKTNDYTELKAKNFWRIVGQSKIDEYNKSKDTSLARIFNGQEMTKLEEAR
jgi:hypothetical protein